MHLITMFGAVWTHNRRISRRWRQHFWWHWMSCRKKLSEQEAQSSWETVRRESQGLLKWTRKWQPRLNDLQMNFKVIKSGTNRKLVYDFLLVVYSNFCRITHHFCEIWCETVQWPWNMSKVIDSRITWKRSCGHVCKMFGKQWTNETKITIFNYPTLNWRPLSREPPLISA